MVDEMRWDGVLSLLLVSRQRRWMGLMPASFFGWYIQDLLLLPPSSSVPPPYLLYIRACENVGSRKCQILVLKDLSLFPTSCCCCKCSPSLLPFCKRLASLPSSAYVSQSCGDDIKAIYPLFASQLSFGQDYVVQPGDAPEPQGTPCGSLA